MSDEPTAPAVGVRRFERHPTTTLLVELFAATRPGDVLTYDEISAAVVCPRDAWQHCMRTAARVLLEKHSIWVECEREVRHRHLTDADARGARGSHAIANVSRAAGRAGDRLTHGVKDKSQIPWGKVAQARLAEHVASPRAGRALETAARNSKLEIGDSLAALGKVK